jgi:hypothetical protein
MTSTPSRVIYPELPDPLTPGDLQQLFSPSFEERKWAPSVARIPVSQVALLVHLKIFQTIGRFLPAAEVPLTAIEHVARRMGLETGTNLIFSDRTLYRHRSASTVLAEAPEVAGSMGSRGTSLGGVHLTMRRTCTPCSSRDSPVIITRRRHIDAFKSKIRRTGSSCQPGAFTPACCCGSQNGVNATQWSSNGGEPIARSHTAT